ncbi:MAG TPA: acyl-CoA dehydrogenase family protein [Trebonia sp.]|nr:acyl-CoA dehydrogenase family protein [Trebonia sp.]
MATIRPRDLLPDALLESLAGTAPAAEARSASNGDLISDIGTLADLGYLKVALPEEFGGLGCTLRQAACGQRRLARYAPDTALAVSAHLYWTGAAADAYRAGDASARWILREASRGALFAGGHGGMSGEIGGDLRFADHRSICEAAGDNGYTFSDPAVLATMTPAWDWVAVHAVHQAARPQAVIAFAGRGDLSAPPLRVARVASIGTPEDVFTTSALTWGHSILASVQYSDAKRVFNAAVTAYAEAAVADDAGLAGLGLAASGGLAADQARVPGQGGSDGSGRPGGSWPVAEAGARLQAMKDKIAEITHVWPLIPPATPDLGGQHLISLYAMRHEVAEGATRVRDLIAQIADGTKFRLRAI